MARYGAHRGEHVGIFHTSTLYLSFYHSQPPVGKNIARTVSFAHNDFLSVTP